MKRILFILSTLLIFSGSLFAEADPEYDRIRFTGSFFTVLENTDPFKEDKTSDEEYLKQILDEAVYIYSGMIYGFSFRYVPYDSARSIKEEFELSPVHSIPWGDEALKVKSSRKEGDLYIVELSYDLHEYQLPWYISWDSGTLPRISSSGEGRFVLGYDGKIDAINNSVKQALRDYLQPRIYNKPRSVSGRVRINSVPYITIDSGSYKCRMSVALEIENLEEYGAF